MKLYMLDTNMVSYVFKQHPKVVNCLISKPIESICISAITEGELQYGLSKRPDAKRLHLLVNEFLWRVDVLSWDTIVAEGYGVARAATERLGKILAPLDMLIAAHALHSNAILVTNDKAFRKMAGLRVEDWTE